MVSICDTEILHLPSRIHERVAMYTKATEDWVHAVIQSAEEQACPRLEALTESYVQDSTGRERKKIVAPIANFEIIVSRLRGEAPERAIDSLKGIITLRTFVSDWYSNIPGLTPGCEVEAKTAQHREFVAMLQRLVNIMEASRGRQKGSCQS